MRIGVDVGGTKIEGIALDSSGVSHARVRVDTPRGDYAATLTAIRDLVATIERDAGPARSVGIGIPGTVSPATGLVKNANSTWLIGRPLERDLEQALARPVRLANDANCFALSEAVDGAAAGARVVFGVILGTGCGGGIVVDGRVLTGPNAVSGEWAHNPLPWPREGEWPGPPCYCGRTGCIETFLSGPALSRDHAEAGAESVTALDVAARADAGDATAIASLERYVDRFARAVTGIINVLDPDVIVVGGGLSNITRLYEHVPPRLRPFGGEAVRTLFVRARHGDSSGVRGAAWLWPPS
jgi:fructokinase